MNEDSRLANLTLCLSAAVPLWIAQFQKIDWARVQKIAEESADIVASKGDVILYKSKRKGESAAAFNGLARAVATLAFAPGGVTLFGLHFEATHPDNPPAKAPSP